MDKLESLRKEVESSKNYFGQVAQECTEEYYSSDNYGCYWESACATRAVDAAEIFLFLLTEMRDRFDKLA